MTKKRVVGVSYEMGDHAPLVVLKGAGETAEAVLSAGAKQEHTRIVKDPALVEQLYKVPIDGPVDQALFPVMATLLIHVLTIDQENKGMKA